MSYVLCCIQWFALLRLLIPCLVCFVRTSRWMCECGFLFGSFTICLFVQEMSFPLTKLPHEGDAKKNIQWVEDRMEHYYTVRTKNGSVGVNQLIANVRVPLVHSHLLLLFCFCALFSVSSFVFVLSFVCVRRWTSVWTPRSSPSKTP